MTGNRRDPHDRRGYRLAMVSSMAAFIEKDGACPSCMVLAAVEAAMDLVDEISHEKRFTADQQQRFTFELRSEMHQIVNRCESAPLVAAEPERPQ